MFKDVTEEMKDKLKVENNGNYKLDIEKLEKVMLYTMTVNT